MNTVFFCLSLFAALPALEARSSISAMGSSSAGLVLIVTAEGGWEERLANGKLVRAGKVDLGTSRFVERAAIAPDGTRWAAFASQLARRRSWPSTGAVPRRRAAGFA